MPSLSWRLSSGGFCAVITIYALFGIARPSEAMPAFSRRYGVACDTCHSVPPRLNSFGLAFQANHFNWPDVMKLAPRRGLQSLPISAIVTASYDNEFSEQSRDTDFRDIELIASDGFRLGRTARGGYLVNALAATTDSDGQAGNLEDAFVALPLGDRGGRVSLLAGQFTQMLYQYDPVNSLTESQPAAIGLASDGFSFLSAAPGVRLDWFDNRSKGTSDGNYLAVGAPFGGALALNHTSRWDGGHGVTLHAFHRKGLTSFGAFGYTRAGNHLIGAILTHDIAPNLHLLGVGAMGRDSFGSSRSLSIQAEYTHKQSLALTGRLDVIRQPAGAPADGGYRSTRAPGGEDTDVGFAGAVTYYPLKITALRLSAELVERRADRVFTLFVRGQF